MVYECYEHYKEEKAREQKERERKEYLRQQVTKTKEILEHAKETIELLKQRAKQNK